MRAMAIIQIRNVSAAAHRTLASRAARERISLSEYLRRELEELASHPTLDELMDVLQTHDAVGGISAADAIAQERAGGAA